MEIEIVKQLAIFLENKPGALLRVTQDLAKRTINILAMSVADSVDHAVVRLVVDKPSEAVHLLGEAGVLVVENDLLKVPVKNRPGELQKFCQKMVANNINIEYAYGSGAMSMDMDFMLYVRVLDPVKAREILKR